MPDRNTDLDLTPDSKPKARKPWATGRSKCPVTDRPTRVGSHVVLLGDTCVSRPGYKQLRKDAIENAKAGVEEIKANIKAIETLREQGGTAHGPSDFQAALETNRTKLAKAEARLEGLEALPTLKALTKSDLLTGNEVESALLYTVDDDMVCGWDGDLTMRKGDRAIQVFGSDGRSLVISRESYVRALRNVWLPLVRGERVITTRILYKGGGVVEIDTDPCLHDYIANEHVRWTGIANGQVRRRDVHGNLFSVEVKADVLGISATETLRRI